ncbi:MAG: M20/M25/M40 family metallo-hydrolase [Candidatus Roizmanbacteria bacterium]|nr:M20/M25/M40 family metallo-hydrolase [Candidatus Roizmanbacteria bacterium]
MINQQRLIDTFITIVQIDSTTGYEDDMASYVVASAQKLGYHPVIDRAENVIITCPGIGEPLLFTAHMDTVEPGHGIKPRVRKGVITSDGTTILGADNKVAVAVLLELLALRSGHSTMGRPLELVFTRGEESGNIGATHLDASRITSKIGYSFDSGEPLGTLFTGSPFYDRFDITITGKGVHASVPEEGNNALLAALPLLQHIRVGHIDEHTIANVGVIQGGSVRNTVPEEVQLQGEVRSFVESHINTVGKKLQRDARQVAASTKTNIKVSIVRENPGYLLKNNHPLIMRALQVLQALHIHPILKKTYACFDANVFQQHGITVLNISDGSRDNHTTRESIRVQDLYALAKIALSLSGPDRI